MHYFVWFFQFLMFLHKLWGLATLLLHEELNIETFMCAGQAVLFLLSFGFALVMIARPKETMDVLNSWPFILSCLNELRNDVPSPYDELSEALKLIALLPVAQGAVLVGAMYSLIFSTLPTCYFPTAERFGLIPEGLLPRFAWQLLFFPLEYATYVPAMLSTSLACSMLLILLGVSRIYLNELR